MRIDYIVNGELAALKVERHGDQLTAHFPGGERRQFAASETESGMIEMRVDDRVIRVAAARSSVGIQIAYLGRVYDFADSRPGAATRAREDHSGELTSPMTGSVADVLAADGDSVTAYQPLVVIEAMKVLATVEAPFDGTVTRVLVQKGDRVNHGSLLIEVART
jgi:biotin carboxyl carrier protein